MNSDFGRSALAPWCPGFERLRVLKLAYHILFNTLDYILR